MLMHLHVKNFALIEEADMEFGSGLNILTGETGYSLMEKTLMSERYSQVH